ncbi:MAG: TVP38/TMEM64 family protein [Actinomycetota bacterium]|nr:TVP38/TMEM64 family protein [Actinomycetota bacterium]
MVARTPPRGRRIRLFVAVLLLGVVIIAAVVLPVPSPLQMRTWSQSVGIAAPLLFLLGHTLATVAPVPRTVFTLAAGLLFGSVLGVALSLLATVLSAVLAFGLVRGLARRLVLPRLDHRVLDHRILDHRVLRAVDARLRRRGWLAVASLRLIPAVPFSVLNYCSALSSIRFRHFLAGTVGVVPGTVAVVVLGDALTGTTSPALLAVSLTGAAIGMIGLIFEARSPAPVPQEQVAS